MPIQKCCVSLCRCTFSRCQLTEFPRNAKLWKVWFDMVAPHSQHLSSVNAKCIKICMHHFEPKYISDKGKRKVFSIPTLFTKKEIRKKRPDKPVDLNLIKRDFHGFFSKEQTNSAEKPPPAETQKENYYYTGALKDSDIFQIALSRIQHDHSYNVIHTAEIVPFDPNKPKVTKDRKIEPIDPLSVEHNDIVDTANIENVNPMTNVVKVTEVQNDGEFGLVECLEDVIDQNDNSQEESADVTVQDNPIQETLVLHHQGYLKMKLNSVLRSHTFCALCYETNKCLKSLDEQLIIVTDQWTQTTLLKYMYTYVFNQEVEDSSSGYMCTECMERLKQSYIFVKQSKLATLLLDSYLNDLASKTDELLTNFPENLDNTVTNTILLLQSDEVDKYLHKDPTYRFKNNTKGTQTYDFDINGDNPEIALNQNLTETRSTQIEPELLETEIGLPKIDTELPELGTVLRGLETGTESETDFPEIDTGLQELDTGLQELETGLQELETGTAELGTGIPELGAGIMEVETEIPEHDTETEIETGLPDLETRVSTLKNILTMDNMQHKNRDVMKNDALLCEFCSMEVAYSARKRHYAEIHSKINCLICQTYVDENDIKYHLISEHKDEVFFCNLCDNPFYTLIRLELHCKIIHNIKATRDNFLVPIRLPKVYDPSEWYSSLKCPDCSEVPCIHERYLNFFIEQKLNHTNATVRCPDCDFGCRRKFAYITHVNIEHLKHCPHICDQCGQQFYSLKALKVHISLYHSQKIVLFCKYCDEKFDTSDVLSNHETNCSLIRREFNCEHCSASFNEFQQLEAHFKRRHKEVFPCNFCNKEFADEKSRTRHINYVHSIREPTKYTFFCDICHEEFVLRSELKNHIKSHGSMVNYRCKICNTQHKSWKALKRHNYTKHRGPFVMCNICGKEIKEALLENHLEAHKLDADVKCHECGLAFKNIARLTTHINKKCHLRTKKLRKKFKCEYCGQITSKRNDMEGHINRHHLHIKPYSCDLCSNTFYGKTTMRCHIRDSHMGMLKRILCSVCEKLITRQNFKVHMLNHIGEKPFQCEICGEGFVSTGKKKLHLLKKHMEKSECCPLCPRKFSIRSDLRKHIMTVHWKDKSNREFDPSEVEGLENHYHLFPRWLEKQNKIKIETGCHTDSTYDMPLL